MALSTAAISCARQRHVCLAELRDAHNAPTESTVRIYLDRYGAYYPRTDVPVLFSDFFDPYAEGDASSDDAYAGSLDFYFTGRYTTTSGDVAIDERAERKERLSALYGAYDIAVGESPGLAFDQVQAAILDSVADELEVLLTKVEHKELVVLVHGFNDANPSGDFARLRQAVEKHLTPRKPVFLEVYWDGLTANQGSPSSSRIWGRAQRNSAYV
ncbi:MAG TPA: hypothetical protein PLB89_17930, partial [Flavobacteriales bacterium]|nr:hypothetical protein [Flavobacteriales bacterium]